MISTLTIHIVATDKVRHKFWKFWKRQNSDNLTSLFRSELILFCQREIGCLSLTDSHKNIEKENQNYFVHRRKILINWKYKKFYLHEVPYIYYKCSLQRWDIYPLILMMNLEATHVVLNKNSQKRRVCMLGGAHCQVWFRTKWVIVTRQCLSIHAFNAWKVGTTKPECFW